MDRVYGDTIKGNSDSSHIIFFFFLLAAVDLVDHVRIPSCFNPPKPT